MLVYRAVATAPLTSPKQLGTTAAASLAGAALWLREWPASALRAARLSTQYLTAAELLPVGLELKL
eukprot:COSAG05_NODE_1195_length_5563_cov_4.163193_1_plen_66_part_00